MDEEKIIRKQTSRKKISINIKVSEDKSKWLKEKNYSPTAIFTEACKELGYGITETEAK